MRTVTLVGGPFDGERFEFDGAPEIYMIEKAKSCWLNVSDVPKMVSEVGPVHVYTQCRYAPNSYSWQGRID